MAGCTKLPPKGLTIFIIIIRIIRIKIRHDNIILSIDTGPQQPWIRGTMGFMAVGAGKDIVISFTLRIRGYSVTPARIVVRRRMVFSVVISRIIRCPVDLFKGTVFGTGNISTDMALS
jgi:hypothetical protein